MLKPLRAEVNALLEAVLGRRKPALRRATVPEALLATDLPHAADAPAVEAFIRQAEKLGWRVCLAENGWLLLDKPVPVPTGDIPALPGRCGCCLSLLQRHPETGDARPYIREAVRAEEAGVGDLIRLCERMHAEFAAMLRLHRPLPGELLPYLARACRTHRGEIEKRKD